MVWLDEGCDGSYVSQRGQTYTDSYTPNVNDILTFDIADDTTSVCFDIEIYDEDSLDADDLLDYITGTGSYGSWQIGSLSMATSGICSESNNNSTEPATVDFEMEYYIV